MRRPSAAFMLAFGSVGSLIVACGGPMTVVEPLPEDPAPTESITKVIERLEAQRDLAGDTMQRYLSDPDPTVRERAAIAIGRVGDPDGLLALATRFGDNAIAVRVAAIVAVSLARDGRFVPEILRVVADPDARVRRAAIAALGHLGAARGFDAIVAALADPDVGVACAAADSCFRLRDSRAIDPLVRALRDARGTVRYHAANALAYLQSPPRDKLSGDPLPLEQDIAAAIEVAVPALIEALADAELDVRVASLDALRRRKRRLDEAAPIQRALGGAPEEAIAAARLAVVQADPTAATAAVASIGHEHPQARWAVVDALRDLAEVIRTDRSLAGTAVQALEARLGQDREPVVRAAALEALAAIDPRSMPALSRFREDADYRLRSAFYRAAGRVGGPMALERLGPGLADADARVRIAVLGALARVGGDGTTARISVALGDRVSGVRARAAEILRERMDATALTTLISAYEDELARPDARNAEARLAMLGAIARLGGKRELPRLERALSDPTPMVRNGAVDLIEALEGSRPEVTYRDESALEARPTTDRELGPQPEVVLHTTRGDIRLRLDARVAPAHVRTFCAMVGDGFYDGKAFHRVVPNHVIQAGDPEGTGYGSANFSLPDEHSSVPFETGTVGMAKLGRDTGSCQFFICLVPRPHLDQRYTAFGRVVGGMRVVSRTMPGDRIVRAEVSSTRAKTPAPASSGHLPTP